MSVPSQSRPGRADRRSVGGFAKKLFVGLGYLSCVHDRILSGSLFGMGDQLAARSGFDRARLISAEITWKKFGGSPAQFHASEKSAVLSQKRLRGHLFFDAPSEAFFYSTV